MVINKKRGHGALEFLMTYGWAVLVILIMIGALAYFGILNPKKFLPSRCTFGNEITCRDFWMNETDVRLRLINNMGRSVNMSSMTASTQDGYFCYSVPASINWGEGDMKDFHFSDCRGGGVTPDTKFKFDILVKWYDLKANAGYMHSVQGQLFTYVEII